MSTGDPLTILYVITDSYHLPRALEPEWPGISRVSSKRVEYIFEIQPGCVNLNLDLAISWINAFRW